MAEFRHFTKPIRSTEKRQYAGSMSFNAPGIEDEITGHDVVGRDVVYQDGFLKDGRDRGSVDDPNTYEGFRGDTIPFGYD